MEGWGAPQFNGYARFLHYCGARKPQTVVPIPTKVCIITASQGRRQQGRRLEWGAPASQQAHSSRGGRSSISIVRASSGQTYRILTYGIRFSTTPSCCSYEYAYEYSFSTHGVRYRYRYEYREVRCGLDRLGALLCRLPPDSQSAAAHAPLPLHAPGGHALVR